MAYQQEAEVIRLRNTKGFFFRSHKTLFNIVEASWNVRHTRRNQFILSAKRTSPFKSAGASVQSTTGNRGVRISGSNAGYTMFRGSVKNTGYPLHSPVSPSLPLPCVTVCHHFSNGVYTETRLDIHSLSTACPLVNKATSLMCCTVHRHRHRYNHENAKQNPAEAGRKSKRPKLRESKDSALPTVKISKILIQKNIRYFTSRWS